MSQLFPYRWLPRTFFSNIYYMFRGIWKGVCNIFKWTPVIFFDEDWDWGYLAHIMEYKMRRMSKCLGNGCHSTAKRDEKQLLMCAELLKRMQKDEYMCGYNNKDFYGGIRDQKLLGKIIGKHFMSWWD